VRQKLEDTFGQFELAQAPESRQVNDEERLVRTLSEAMEQHRVVEIEYLKEGEDEHSTRRIEPYSFERVMPHWLVHSWDLTVGSSRSYRLDRMRSARLTDETFAPREGFDPNFLVDTSPARVLYSKRIARWKVERGAVALVDKTAVASLRVGKGDWLAGEIMADRGEAVVLEPAELRPVIAKRAAQLVRELKLTRVRVPG
jgi:predicted DNA-binding transcriptional regulator YafY